MNTSKWLAIGVVISLIFTLTMNSLSNTDLLGEGTIASVSSKYTNLFTPAGYAFSIWGLIYLSLIAFSVLQLRVAWSQEVWAGANHIRLWFILTNLLNAFWLVAWLNERLGWALCIMAVLLLGLLVILITIESKPELFSASFVRYPFQLYAGWITVAIIANTSAYLTQLGFSWGFSDQAWTVIILVVALMIYALMLWQMNVPIYAAVGVWATLAIAYKQWGSEPIVSYTALGVALILSILIVLRWLR